MNTTIKPLVGAVALALSASVVANDFVLEEVVVTAQKRAQNMNDVSVAITAFSGEQMQELGITSAVDVAINTPGLVMTETQPAGIPIYTIRGVGFDDISVSSSSTVGVYVDEVALPYPVMTRGLVFDVERIEVLKGPQGDLYGRNNTGGAINFVSNKPSDQFEAGTILDYGRYNYVRAEGFVSGPVTQNLLGRVALNITKQDEWQQSITTDDELGKKDEFAGRILLDWAAGDSVDVLFNLHANRDKSDNQAPFAIKTHNFGAPVTKVSDPVSVTNDPTLYIGLATLLGAPVPTSAQDFIDMTGFVQQSKDPRKADWSLKPGRDNNAWGTSVTVNWDINDDYSLTSITAYDYFERDETFDYDGTSLEIGDIANKSEIASLSQELRISYDAGGDLTWIGGLYLSTDSVDEEIDGSIGNTLGGSGGGFGFNSYRQEYDQDTDTQGVFGHAEWQFAEQFRVIAGIRYTHEEREWTGCTYDVDGGITWLYTNLFGYTTPDGPFQQGDCLTIDGNSVDPEGGDFLVDNPGPFNETLKTDNVSGKIGLDYLPNDDWLIYGSVSSGFKSGGFNGNPANDYSQLAPYDEEELLAYELGFKATLLEQTMQLNGALFYYDYSDKQVYDTIETFFGPLVSLTNVPESTIQGGELELQWRPIQGLDVKLAASYLDSRVEEFIDFYGEDEEGKDLPQTPKWQYNGVLSYEFPVADGLFVRATTDFSYSDSYHTLIGTAGGTVNYDEMQTEDWWLVNARLGIGAEDGTWNVAAWVRNLQDEYYQPTINYGNDIVFGMAGMGRTYGVSLTYYWD